MLKDNIYLNDGTTPQQYVLVGQNAQDSKRVRTDSLLGLPQTLAVKHSASGGRGQEVDRHLVQVTNTVKDGNGIARIATVNMTVTVPREGFTVPQIQALINQMISFWSSDPSTQDTTAGVPAKPAHTGMVGAITRGES